MASSADIKKRIKSVANTRQITKAMEVVSATKMRRAQELALRARPYAMAAFELLAAVSSKISEKEKLPAMLIGNQSTKTLVVIIASDKGLAGSLNANVMRKAVSAVGGNSVDIATVGKKGKEYFGYRGYNIVKEFTGHSDYVDSTELNQLHDFISEAFLAGTYGKVVVVYTNFLSTLRQEPVIREILPISEQGLREMADGLAPTTGKYSAAPEGRALLSEAEREKEPYLYEPSREKVLAELVDRLFRMTLYHIQTESNASEHSARMVAMKTASENAEEIVDDLTLLYNNRRQAKITQEIVEITSGSDAVQ